MRPVEWAVWSGAVAWGAIWHLGGRLGLDTEWMGLPRQAAHLLLAGAAAWSAWQGRGGDLVEPRRQARIAYIVLSSVLIIGVTASYIAPGAPPAFAGDLNVARLFVTAIGMALLVSGVRADALFDAPQVAVQPGLGRDTTLPVSAGPDEARLLGRLQRMMAEERIYRVEGLSIGALAARVGTPEYALRRLINGRLGHRNFNAYLNSYRLAEAKAALADPEQRNVPISTIAMDAGFGSLGPFNRAFKAAEGVTPSEYREGIPEALRSPLPISESA
jgi:AraC-like DNA-binding protein